jgi:predicted aconitase
VEKLDTLAKIVRKNRKKKVLAEVLIVVATGHVISAAIRDTWVENVLNRVPVVVVEEEEVVGVVVVEVVVEVAEEEVAVGSKEKSTK